VLEQDSFTTEFVMPDKYRENLPPTPTNDRITIKKEKKGNAAPLLLMGPCKRKNRKK